MDHVKVKGPEMCEHDGCTIAPVVEIVDARFSRRRLCLTHAPAIKLLHAPNEGDAAYWDPAYQEAIAEHERLAAEAADHYGKAEEHRKLADVIARRRDVAKQRVEQNYLALVASMRRHP